MRFRANTIKEIKANHIAPDFEEWCNNTSDCLYKDKKRRFHGWLNLTNLSTKNKVAQCGWDNGDCNHTTHYGVGGYHNVCPIGGMNGDYVWPAKLQLSNFGFKAKNITSTAKIKQIDVHLEHRMVAIDTGTGIKYDNFGPDFHQGKDGWVMKLYFTNGSEVVSKTKLHRSNPKLSKQKFDSINYSFYNIPIDDFLDNNFALNIEYNHNYNTEAGIIYIRNVYIDVTYEDASMYMSVIRDAKTLYTNTEQESVCTTKINHVISAGYKNGNGIIPVNKAPKKLGSLIKCIKKPKNVDLTLKSENDLAKRFEITDKSGIEGKKSITYGLIGYPKETIEVGYTAIMRNKPTYSIIDEYKSNEDFDPDKKYIVFKDGCCSDISIYIDSIDDPTPITLSVTNQNSKYNLLSDESIRTFHTAITSLSCGRHTLYIKRGDESLKEVSKNKVSITILPMDFKFKFYKANNPDSDLIFTQSKSNQNRTETIVIERIDDEPQKSIPNLFITDETNPTVITTQNNIKKGDRINYTIDKYYSGEYYISVQSNNTCQEKKITKKITIESSHKQNYDYLFTRGEDGTAFDFDYLVAWEGDNIREPLVIDSIELKNSSDDIRICSDPVSVGLSQVGVIDLKVKNKTQSKIEGVEIELNTLVKDENGELNVTTSEWTDEDGIFNQFYELFKEYNVALNNNVDVLNLTQDNDLVDEENVYLFIHQIDAEDTVSIKLPFKSVNEKTVYLQYLLFEEPININSITNCESLTSSNNREIEINVHDSMLTNLEIIGQTDLLVLDQNHASCPTECYTTKETDEFYTPIDNKQSGGITYRITNVDSNDFESQRLTTEILNDNELKPYGYIINNQYYDLLDQNGDPIDVQENIPLLDYDGNQLYEKLKDNQGNLILDGNGNTQNDYEKPLYQTNKLKWEQKEETINKPMKSQNISCTVSFPNNEEISYTVKTNKNGLANFFIPIPTNLSTTYTINELLTDVLVFRFKEQKDYNESILTKNSSYVYPVSDPNKNNVIMDYSNNFKRYKPGEVAEITIFISADIKTIRNHFVFKAQLGDIGSQDEVTILYQICNIDNNEGIFTTTFQTNDKQLIPNKVSKKIYCGIMSKVHVDAQITKKVVELSELNIIYINVRNENKENKNVNIQIDLGKIPLQYLGSYDFIDINIKNGDYSITEEHGNMYVNWLIGEMDESQEESAIIKIKAKDIGLSNIIVQAFDYLHLKDMSPIEIKKSSCKKCNNNSKWKIKDSKWEKFDDIWYKLFPDGTYKKPVTRITEEGQYVQEWVDKE